MPYFICQQSRQKFKLSDEICLLKKCEFLLDMGRGFECTAQVKKVIKKLEGAKYGGLIPSANKR